MERFSVRVCAMCLLQVIKAGQLPGNKATVDHFLLTVSDHCLSSSSLVKKFHLVEMSQILQELIYFVSEALEKLTWSFEFHKNYLFGKNLMQLEEVVGTNQAVICDVVVLWCNG